jgi:hypothetical protein
MKILSELLEYLKLRLPEVVVLMALGLFVLGVIVAINPSLLTQIRRKRIQDEADEDVANYTSRIAGISVIVLSMFIGCAGLYQVFFVK